MRSENIKLKMKDLRPDQVAFASTLTTSILIGFFIVLTFFPGVGDNDTYTQLLQLKTLQFTDHHPPALPVIWGIGEMISGSLGSLLVIQVALTMTSFAVMSWRLSEYRFGVLFPFLSLTPIFLGLMGALQKDVLMASLLLLTSVVFMFPYSKKKFVLAAVLIGLALALRHNAFPAAIPLMIFAALIWKSKESSKVTAPLKKVSLITALVVAIPLVFNLWTAPVKTHQENHIFVDDLAAISLANGESYIPGVDFSRILECEGSSYFGFTDNGFIRCLDGWNSMDLRQESFMPQWFDAITKNPAVYIEYRSARYAQYFGFGGSRAPKVFQNGSIHNIGLPPGVDFTFEENVLFLGLKRYILGVQAFFPWLYSPLTWLLAGIVVLIGLPKIKMASEDKRWAATILASSILYIMSYFPTAVGSDFRYSLWSIWAAAFVTSFILIQQLGKRDTGS